MPSPREGKSPGTSTHAQNPRQRSDELEGGAIGVNARADGDLSEPGGERASRPGERSEDVPSAVRTERPERDDRSGRGLHAGSEEEEPPRTYKSEVAADGQNIRGAPADDGRRRRD